VGGWGQDPFSRNWMSPTPRRKWYLTMGRRAHLMVLDPIPQSLPVHFFGSRPQPLTSPSGSTSSVKSAKWCTNRCVTDLSLHSCVKSAKWCTNIYVSIYISYIAFCVTDLFVHHSVLFTELCKEREVMHKQVCDRHRHTLIYSYFIGKYTSYMYVSIYLYIFTYLLHRIYLMVI